MMPSSGWFPPKPWQPISVLSRVRQDLKHLLYLVRIDFGRELLIVEALLKENLPEMLQKRWVAMLNADADRFAEARLEVGMIVGPEIVQEWHIYQELDMSACGKNNPLSFHADTMVRPTYPGIEGLGLCCND
jgi:hypothetical protein